MPEPFRIDTGILKLLAQHLCADGWPLDESLLDAAERALCEDLTHDPLRALIAREVIAMRDLRELDQWRALYALAEKVRRACN